MIGQDLLTIENLEVRYGETPVLQSVSLALQAGSILGIVGESGSGKSTLLLATMGILGRKGSIQDGRIIYQGTDLLQLSAEKMRRIRGKEIALIMQNPNSSFCPVRKIKHQLHEAVRSHGDLSGSEADRRMLELLARMNLPDGKRIMNSYAFQMSGGMCQRTAIAVAMVLRPQLLLADEPTSALDVTVQAQVIKEIMNLRTEFGTSVVIVSHNMGVISHMADQIAVMYGGLILEYGVKDEIIGNPAHRYTQNIIRAIPRLGAPAPRGIAVFQHERRTQGCPVQKSCPNYADQCLTKTPPLKEISKGHFLRC
ncbi:ABC transporter ATP-binding protein [Desulfosporosinus shakirovi]|uniref:ABC transporter ATP-binding protein n=1 Tax=Desulfosporosinus shakirovi TaxID=2885154 RepID=UPI001E5F72C1|nr:ABC transporter ATP-binding protein [Desulfosporosinus sp. SRJS8]MCB8818224.1 ABC transporter ATP-binding protein [Desulfosporosinus sp. SRJS8]